MVLCGALRWLPVAVLCTHCIFLRRVVPYRIRSECSWSVQVLEDGVNFYRFEAARPSGQVRKERDFRHRGLCGTARWQSAFRSRKRKHAAVGWRSHQSWDWPQERANVPRWSNSADNNGWRRADDDWSRRLRSSTVTSFISATNIVLTQLRSQNDVTVCLVRFPYYYYYYLEKNTGLPKNINPVCWFIWC